MPDRNRVQAFIEMVESGDHVRAIADFYHEHASMQEPGMEPRRGREALMAHEARGLARLDRMITHPPRGVAIDGDHVFIRWVFDAVDRSGVTRRLEEVACQTWESDRISEERFFYDHGSSWQIVNSGV